MISAYGNNMSIFHYSNTYNSSTILLISLVILTFTISSVESYVAMNTKHSNKRALISSSRCYTITERQNVASSEIPFEKPTKDMRTKLEIEFDTMVNEFKEYSSYDIACIENDRYRVLFEGVASGVKEPAVYRSFVVLFEDYAPVRIAGRMIYKHLSNVMSKSKEAIAMETHVIQKRTGLPTEDIIGGRLAYLAVVQEQEEGDQRLTMEQLINSGIVSTVIEILGYDSFQSFLTDMDHDNQTTTSNNNVLTFETFMIGLQNCAQNSCEESCDISTVLQDLQTRMGPLEQRRQKTSLDQRKKKYSDRYDNMITFFQQNQQLLLPTSNSDASRIELILQGCIVGAQNPNVVNALRVVYLDYSALRIAGDLIFKLVSVLVNKKKKKMQ